VSHPVTVPQIDIDAVTTCFRNSVRRAGNEEEVRVWVSKCIEDEILKPLGIREVGRYEYLLVSGARVDALYGHVVVEFKAPGKLASQSDIQRAKEQVIRYIVREAGSRMEWSRYLGVIVSDRIAFVRYDPRTDMWILRGPYDIRREVVIKLIEALRGLRRKPLDADHLIKDFGPKSQVARELVSQLYTKLLSSGSPRTKILFDDWMRLFKQATGYKPEELEELPELAKEYDLKGSVNYDALIFSIHTYYALLLKLIAAEIAYLYGAGKFYKSYIADLEDSYARGGVEGLRDALRELESGGIFRRLLRIENFLEGDYFSWYLDELDEKLGDAIARLVRALSDYEVATPQLEPEFARDLLKRLYQNLVPSDLRHRLGEYYTPDWLANLLLDEVGLGIDNLRRMGEEDPLKPLEIRVLDPACGSGTFLILYISRLRKYAEEHFLLDTLLNYVLNNVVGYDLNPLAVLTARTNYLLAIADLLAYASGTIEIPVYLADSIMVERRAGPYGDVYILKTVVSEFEIPTSVIKKGLLQKILAEISWSLENKYTREDFSRRVEHAYKLTEEEIVALARSYERLYKLEEEGKNRVWVSVIRNAFAPILKGRFDYVVGNPPWVNWENLPEEYRKISKPLWDYYGMSKVISTGAFKKDLAMLFLIRCFDLYLKPGGKLGFLVPFTVFKTQAGAGFRTFLARRTKIHVVHDLVALKPFEGAVNMTGAVVVEKLCDIDLSGMPEDVRKRCEKSLLKAFEENVGGIKHFIWVSVDGKPVPTDKPLEEVLKETRRYEVLMAPLEHRKPETPWMQVTPKALEAVRKLLAGTQYYKAHAGIYVALNQVYYVQIKGKTPDGKLIITNPPEPDAKKKVKQVEAVVEPDLVYPLLRGKDVKRWYAEYKDRYVITPHDPTTGKPYKPEDMKVKFPNTYSYFIQYKEELKKRSIKPFLSLREKIKKARLEAERKKAEEELNKNFYIIDNIGAYTFSPYKIVWKEITQKGGFACAVLREVNDRYLGSKVPIPDHKLMLVPLASADEAYYLAGVLNSLIVRSVVTAYVSQLETGTHILDYIKIPKYDLNNGLHRKIAELSRRAHELAKCIYAEKKPDYCRSVDAEEELRRVERELDLVVAQLFGLSEEELREFERLMAILSGGELPVEEEVEVPEEPLVTISNTLLRPNVESYVEVDVVNPSREEITFYYELPGRRGSFKLVEGRYRLPVPPLKPGSYGCVLRYVWRGVERVLEFTVEVSEETGPRRRRTLADLG
jgi:type II restriction/modification system DNA methylase subunit YeeA